MVGQVGRATLSPSGPAFLLLLLGPVQTSQDTCSSPGDLPPPDLLLNTSNAREGQGVLLHCSIDGHSPATRIVFCKDGVEEFSLEAQQGQLSYSVLLIMMMGRVGTYTCGYQHKIEVNWVRNSALSTPWNLTVTDPHPPVVHTFPTGIVLGVVAVSLLLLAAASYCAVKKGACRVRCQSGADSAEDSSADNGHYYVNIEELDRVEVSRPNCSGASL